MPYYEVTGNIFNSKSGALVNTVNCVGAMGKGIALEFRRRYPEMFKVYQQDCQEGKLRPGRIYPYPQSDLLILNFAIKDNWKFPSKIEWIESSLRQFVAYYKQKGIHSIAFPWMGAMNGGIPLNIIQAITRRYLQNLPDIEVEVYNFDPDATDPLFEVLKKVAATANPSLFLEQSGLQRKAFELVISMVQQGKAKSLARLVESRVVGETSIDKLYIFLTANRHLLDKEDLNNTPKGPTQLSLGLDYD